jgi:glutaredoxin 2
MDILAQLIDTNFDDREVKKGEVKIKFDSELIIPILWEKSARAISDSTDIKYEQVLTLMIENMIRNGLSGVLQQAEEKQKKINNIDMQEFLKGPAGEKANQMVASFQEKLKSIEDIFENANKKIEGINKVLDNEQKANK